MNSDYPFYNSFMVNASINISNYVTGEMSFLFPKHMKLNTQWALSVCQLSNQSCIISIIHSLTPVLLYLSSGLHMFHTVCMSFSIAQQYQSTRALLVGRSQSTSLCFIYFIC
jgi:hypothetical protein